ncbi:MAG: hypothetical protein ACYS7Y_04365 [Planctomycetota bacterium]|jgi:hypothetical protein
MRQTEILEEMHAILRDELPSGNKGRDLYWSTKLAALAAELSFVTSEGIARIISQMPLADMKATTEAAKKERKRLREMG